MTNVVVVLIFGMFIFLFCLILRDDNSEENNEEDLEQEKYLEEWRKSHDRKRDKYK